MAAAAELDTNAETSAPPAPKAIATVVVERATPGMERTARANRRSSPCTIIAWARMNPPITRNSVDDENAS
jgi:hypothetical protein